MEIILILAVTIWYLLCAMAIFSFTGYIAGKEKTEGCFSVVFIFGMSFFWPIALPLWIIISCIFRLISKD